MIFKKSIRTWVAIILSLTILCALMYCIVAWGFLSDAAETKSDPRYLKILADIQSQKIDVEKLQNTLSAKRVFSLKDMSYFVVGMAIFSILYTLIFRCMARIIFGVWKSPWIS